ncbi:uncharacterized protein [Drosophila takahashii]|uniref:uncharacterized protein n=1 Tax=Drosophila takahashii TaxID=29030 RepID=UPI001CF85BEE|nr:uncharacterized protein LOC108061307 [Drosophila takahashii]
MNRHEGIVCKGCAKESFMGRCYRCLSCRQFDMCADCYRNDFVTADHPFDHPVMCIYTPADVELYFGGEYISSDPPQSYRCPYCKRWGFNESTFLEHVSSSHPNANPQLVTTMVTLFEQQQAARLFLEDEQLASLLASATSRNEQMRRTVGSLDLYLVPLNPDGSYRKAEGKKENAAASKCREMVARERIFRVTRRSGGPTGRSSASSRALPAPASGSNSTNDTSLDLEDDIIAIATNPRLNWMQRNVAAAERLHFAISETDNSTGAPTAAPTAIVSHPSLTEMMRFYGGMPQEQPATRLIRSRPANPAPQAANTGSNSNRTIQVYGPTSAFTQAQQNARSLYLAQELFSRDERRRSARMPTFQGNNAGGLQRLGINSRALTARNVDFSELPPEESDVANLNAASVENFLRCLRGEEPAKVIKQREQERRRFLCYRFLMPRISRRPQENFLLLRAEFVSQLLSSALFEEDFQRVSIGSMAPKRKILTGSRIAGAGDAEKNSPPA